MSAYRPGGLATSRGGLNPSHNNTNANSSSSSAPRGYVPGLGRGAAGFTTRSDIGPAAGPRGSSGGNDAVGNDVGMATTGSGSRAAELRAAKLQMKAMQQQQQVNNKVSTLPRALPFGAAPEGYVAGAGRGAGFNNKSESDGAGPTGGGSVGGAGATGGDSSTGPTNYDAFGGYNDNLFGGTPYDDDDQEADRIYGAIDERMGARGDKRKRYGDGDGKGGGGGVGKIGNEFRELKDKLKDVSEEEWNAIPDVGDYSLWIISNRLSRKSRGILFFFLSGIFVFCIFPLVLILFFFRSPVLNLLKMILLISSLSLDCCCNGSYFSSLSPTPSLKHKQKRRADVFTPLTDSLLLSRTQQNTDATSGGPTTKLSNTSSSLPSSSTTPGFKSVVTNMSGLAEARGTVLGMSLDRATTSTTNSSISSQSTIDPKGYLTSLSSIQIATSAEIGDITKARQLLKSVRDTNPRHAPGWIAAARVEEAAGKMLQARKIIQEGCEVCSNEEDVWLEAARLHDRDSARAILASAIRRLRGSVKLFLRAVDLENKVSDKRAVLRKALEANPTSVTLWKAAIELEDAEDAKILLSVAVEKVPHSVEMWLALARLETYDNARKVLNRARRALPASRAIWIAASKLEESRTSHNNGDDDDAAETKVIDTIISRAVRSLQKHEAVVTRAQWLNDAEAAEASGAPLTAAAIVRHTVGMGVEAEDRVRTWSDDALGAAKRGKVGTARAILAHALASFPMKKALWMQAVDLEKKQGSTDSLDEVLKAASQRLPRMEIFWLVRAKERWVKGDVEGAREILSEAFAANPDSEAVWLAAAKLEWETGEVERARVLFRRARDRAPTERVFMKSALLERESANVEDALDLIEEGLNKFPKFAKLYMMAGQICSQDFKVKDRHALDRARKFYQRGLENCPNSSVLWILTSRLEENAASFDHGTTPSSSTKGGGGGVTKARSLLELARLQNPKTPTLWLESIRLERRSSNPQMALSLTARALQECPTSGLLLAENIYASPRPEQKSKSADAIKKCPDDARVICAVATLFQNERKVVKARKWFERAVVLDGDWGDSWGRYYLFELEQEEQGQPQQKVSGEDAPLSALPEKVKERCIKADPRHGEIWCRVRKDMKNLGKSIGETLELVVKELKEVRR